MVSIAGYTRERRAADGDPPARRGPSPARSGRIPPPVAGAAGEGGDGGRACQGASLRDHWALSRVQAGYQTAFSSVAMNTPLWPAVPARYSFPAAGGILFVDIGSGAITVEGNVS